MSTMHSASTYPVSASSAPARLLVVDDKQTFPRYTSNDSGVSFDDNDEFASICSDESDSEFSDSTNILNDVQLAATIRDDEKKFFCDNTAWAWHGEFGRLIMAPAMTFGLDYRLMLHDTRSLCPRASAAHYSLVRVDNAKAQFKCETCGRGWTSMRARCSFHISQPHEGGIVLLKLFNQHCESCYSTVHPLWYYGNPSATATARSSRVCFAGLDEICRVMKNLASTIVKHCFPRFSPQWTRDGTKPTGGRRPVQRKGTMHGQHNFRLCEACHLGVCY